MVQKYEGVDTEFAVSTGRNVDTTENSSTFDNPPAGSKDLIITSNDGDKTPNVFSVGDTYDVEWGGQGGGGMMEDAVVIRSDAAPGDDAGIVVLEGTDQNGDPAQVIWTPGFDLEGWYKANYNPSAEPQFWTEDQNASYTHSFVCFAAGTRIRVPGGHCPVEALTPGDLVWTRDAGPQPLRWVGRRRVLGIGPDAPVVFAPGSLGNDRPLHLSQQHRVLVRSPLVQLYFGIDEALVPAKALVNGRDIRIRPRPAVEYVHLLLDAHHLLMAEGALSESLYLGDQATRLLYDDAPLMAAMAASPELGGRRPARPILTVQEARLLANAPAYSDAWSDCPLALM